MPAPAVKNAENGHGGGGAHPQPLAVGQFVPAGFIDIDHRLLLHMRLRRFHRCLQRLTDALLLSRNASQADLDLKDRFQQFVHVPMADPEPPTQIADHSLQPFAKTAAWHVRWPLGSILGSTPLASQRMPLIFDDVRHNFRQFTHLMPFRV